MKKYLLSVIVLAVLGMAFPASAQITIGTRSRQPLNQIGPVGCPYMDVDMCFTYGDWWGTSIGPGGTVDTYCGLSGGCWACLPNLYGKLNCSYGVDSGACNCEMQQRVGAGPGIEDCAPSGNCQTTAHA